MRSAGLDLRPADGAIVGLGANAFLRLIPMQPRLGHLVRMALALPQWLLAVKPIPYGSTVLT
jgi:hypothetical protein